MKIIKKLQTQPPPLIIISYLFVLPTQKIHLAIRIGHQVSLVCVDLFLPLDFRIHLFLGGLLPQLG